MYRRFCVAGNWKMNGTRAQIYEYAKFISQTSLDENAEIIFAFPSILLGYAHRSFPSSISIAAQNCYKEDKGAFTGEVSAVMIKDAGCEWVIIGHSERRTLFGEDDELIARKITNALKAGLNVIACIGETLHERESRRTEDVIYNQMASLRRAVGDGWNNVVIAYEPIWAIGTGKAATLIQAQEIHSSIRYWIGEHISWDVARSVRILYGGSVNKNNCRAFACCPDIDGFMVGAASLTTEFVHIVNSKQF